MNEKRWKLSLPVVMALSCLVAVAPLRAAEPPSGTISPASPPVMWDGTAAGGVSNGEDTCVEGVNCDTYTLTVSGTPADWAGKRVEVRVTWVVLANDYDLYIHKTDNSGKTVDSSTNGAPSTSEVAFIEPAADGTGVFTVRVAYFTGHAADNYHAVASVVTSTYTAPPPLSPNWTINHHGTCCEGNLSAAGNNTYMLLPVLLTGNKIKRSTDGGKTWTQQYPPADASVPFGIEGDMQAFGDDVIFFGTELATAVVAHSDNRGDTWTVVQAPLASAGNDQAWSYLGPFGDLNPAGALPTNEPYVLAGWMRIGSAVAFSFDGGLSWPIQTPLVGNNGSGPEHVVCHNNAVDPPNPAPADTRIANTHFRRQKAGRHGAWGTDKSFYWSETVEGTLYVCKTSNFGTSWSGTKHPVPDGPAEDFVVTQSAFDDKGTFYVLHGDKLYVSFNQGQSFAYVHTLPRYGDAGRSDSGSDQYFVVSCGTIHIGLLADGGEGRGFVYYLRGANVDTANPTWEEELVDAVDNVRLDFMYIVMDGNDIPTISYTTPDLEVTTASRKSASASCLAVQLPSITTVEVTCQAISSITLTVTGAHFVPDSVVRVNGTARPTTYVSPTQLRVTFLISDLGPSNAIALQVANAGGILSAVFNTNIPLLGDLNLDKSVEAQDLVIMANFLVDNATPGAVPFTAPLSAADLNRNSTVDAVDYVILANFLVDNISCLPTN